jgi:protocatechuate 3,4-dioxygenase beta subunit
MFELFQCTLPLSLALSVLLLPWPVHGDVLGLSSGLPTGEHCSATPASTIGQIDRARRPPAFRARLAQPAFIDNQGQVDERARLYLRSGRQTLWLTNEGVVFDLRRVVSETRAPTAEHRPRRLHSAHERLVFAQEFLGASQAAVIERSQPLPGAYNYYLGNDPARWRTGVRAYGEVMYREVWRGVDLRLYGNGRHLEQEFVIRPGGDPGVIRVAYRGIEGLRVAGDGALLIQTAFGELRESPPTIYQEIDGKRVAVGGRFKLIGPTAYTFEVDPYRPRYALVIDPTLVYATYLGGAADDRPLGMAVDDRGHAYVAGDTASLDFPTQDGLQPPAGGVDIFVARLNRAGDALQFSTYVGGSGDDTDPAIAIDAAGGAYVVGSTTSPDFPTRSSGVPLQSSPGGGRDAFVVRIDSAGALAYSTYLGGTGDETGIGIAVDPLCQASAQGCSVYVSGTTESAGFLPASGAQPSFGGVRDAFIVKLDATGSTRLGSSYLGGSGAEEAGVLVVGADGSVYVTGQTSSTNFPTKNPIQSSLKGPADAFITKLSADLSTLIYSTYFGGSGTDGGNQIVVDALGNMFVAGQTNSSDLTPVNAVQSAPGGGFDGFVLKLNSAGSAVLYLTYLGGPGFDEAFSIALDDAGNAYVTGRTAGDLPTHLAQDTTPQPTIGGGGGTGAYVAKLSSTGSKLLYLTYLGDATNELGGMVAVDASSSAYVAVGTSSTRTNVLSSNLGLGDSFQTSTAAAWTTGGASKLSNAVAFTVPGSQTYRLAQFRFAADWLSGTNSAHVGLYAGSDLNTATLLESFTFSASAQATAELFTAVSTVRPLLLPGNTYFISLSVDGPSTTWGWRWNDQGMTGYLARSGAGAWVAASAVTPAFDVSATPEFGGAGKDAYVAKLGPQRAGLSGSMTEAQTPPGCNTNSVSLSLQKSATSITNGDTVTYTVTVANGDTPGCQAISNVIKGFCPKADGTVGPSPAITFPTIPTLPVPTPTATIGTFQCVVTVDAGVTTAAATASLAGLLQDNPAQDDPFVFVRTVSVTVTTPPPQITGHVRNAADSSALQGAIVSVSPDDPGGTFKTVSVEADGSYAVTGLTSGTYHVQAQADGFATQWYQGQAVQHLGQPVGVSAGGTTTGIDFALVAGAGGIGGRVTQSDGTPIQNASVCINASAGGFVLAVQTDAQGNYNTGLRLGPGTYKAQACLDGFPNLWYSNAVGFDTATLITVGSGATASSIDFVLPDTAAAIAGVVTNAATGLPIAGTGINITDTANGGVVFTTSQSDGSYSTGRRLLPPGPYKVQANATGFVPQFYNNKLTADTANTVTVNASADTTGINFALSPGGSIAGKVTREDGVTPIAGATVNVSPDSPTGTFASATTDANGDYTVTSLAGGSYHVQAEADGFATQWYDGQPTQQAGQSVLVNAGTTTAVNFAMAAGAGGISGQVTRPDGTRLAFVSICISPSTGGFVLSVQTDSQGRYTTSLRLAAGSYKIQACSAGVLNLFNDGAVDFSTAPPVPVTGNATTSGKDFILADTAAGVSGTVLNAVNGLPIAGATITVTDTANGFVRSTTSQSDGTYSTGRRLLPPGPYKVQATATGFASQFFANQPTAASATLVTVTANSDTTGVSFQLSPGGSITGAITRSDTNAPVTGVAVDVFEAAGNALVKSGTTNASGIYTITQVEPGDYKVRARLANFATTFHGGGRVLVDANTMPVTVTEGGTSQADISMAPAGGIVGTVTDAATSAGVGGVAIDVYDANNNSIESTTTSGTGSYTLRRFQPGAYKVRARAQTYATTFNAGKHTFPIADLVIVQSGNDTSVNFALEKGSNITGTITDASGSPVLGAFVDIYEARAANFVEGAFVTDVNGNYSAESRLPAGSYVIRARRGNAFSSVGLTFYNGKRGFSTADTVKVDSGQTVSGKNIQMDPGKAFTGTITDGANPVPGAQIDIVDASTGSVLTNNFLALSFRTNSNGVFDTGPQFSTAGQYKIRVRLFPSNRIDTYYHAGSDIGLDLFTATPLRAPATANVAVPAGGVITGTVRERGTNIPLPGVPVNTFRFASNTYSGAFTVLTDINGNYTVGGLIDGEWVVRADAPGHITAYYSGDPNNPATDMQTATPVVISDGGTVDNVAINLATGGGVIRGLITRHDNGQPVPAGSTVQLRTSTPRTSFIESVAVSSFNLCPGAATPCNYMVSNLASADYSVEVFGSSFESDTAVGWYSLPPADSIGIPSRGSPLPVHVTSGSATMADFEAPAFGDGGSRAISGFVRDSEGNPLPFVQIGAFEPGGTGVIRFVQANGDGSFFLNHLAPGRYLVRADTETSFVTIAYALDTTAGLPGQPYPEPLLSSGALVDVAAADAPGIEIRLPGTPGTITGTVTRVCPQGDPSGCTPGNLVGLMGASVSVQNFSAQGAVGATTRADGSYLVRGIAPGFYKVRVSAPGPGFITRYYRCDNPPCAASTGTGESFDDGSFIAVSAGRQVSNISMILDPGGGSIAGTVRAPGGAPVVGALLQARQATSGAVVYTATSAVDGSYVIPQLATGNYTVRVFFSRQLGFVTQWYSGKPTREAADAVSVTAPATTAGVDFVVDTDEGTLSGTVTDSAGRPVAGVAVSVFDPSGGFVRGTSVTGKDGTYSVPGLGPGSYVAQALALGDAPVLFGGVPDLPSAAGLTVETGQDTPGINFTVTRSSDIAGTISYVGQKTGALMIGLFADAGLAHRLYNLTIDSPVFPQAYRFSKPAPDTQGILPGTYYVGAFIDSNPNGVQDAVEASGMFGGATPTPVGVAEGATRDGADFALTDGVSVAGTTSVARSIPDVVVPPDGNPGATLGDLLIIENGARALSAAGRIQLTLPPLLTFASMPAVSTLASNGLKIWQAGPDDPANCTGSNVPTLEQGNTRFSFAVCERSTKGPAQVLISSLIVNVPSGFVPDGPPCVPVDPPSNRVCMGIGASLSNGLTPAIVTNAAFFPPPAVPTLAGMSTSALGQGVTSTVTLSGFNFTQLDFEHGDTIDFGPGITVLEIKIDGDTQITVKVKVDSGAALGNRTVTITNNPSGDQLILKDQFTVDAPPKIDSAGTRADGTGPLLSNVKLQSVYINGSGFQSPPNLLVLFSGSGITVTGVACNPCPTQIKVDVDVDMGAEADSPRTVTVINPDLGSATTGPSLAVTLPPPDAPVGLGNPKTVGTSKPPSAPSVSGVSPSAAKTGAFVTITGTGFSATRSADSVTFAGLNSTRVVASLNPAIAPTTTSLSVQVPAQAVDGPVTVAVNGVQSSNAATFTVSNPVLSSVTPGSVARGGAATVDLLGVKLDPKATVTFNPPGDVSVGTPTQVGSVGTHLQVPVTVGSAAAIGLRDVAVINPDGAASTLPKAFEITLNSAATLALTLLNAADGSPIDIGSFTPSVKGVQVSLDSTGKCTGKTITPTAVIVQAQFTTPPAALPPTLTFTLASSALPGTATNEDCELNPLAPNKDFSIGQVNTVPDVTAQQVVVGAANGVYQARLAVWDWGGNVLITVTDNPAAPTIAASLALPVDRDRDGLPDAYERDAALNANPLGVNVLDSLKADANANGILDGDDRFALDGLTNFEKYRGVYLKAPINGSANAPMLNHVRLGAGMRNLFVRGQGFASDPAMPPGTCGVDLAGNPVQQDAAYLGAYPCPVFQVGDAFRSIGVQVWDVAASTNDNPGGSFSATTVFPIRSLADPTKPMLDLATVVYDAQNCAGGATCDHTSKLGVRQWQFPTMGFSTFGSATTYGAARVFAKSVKGYFTDRPYLHQENLPGTYLPLATTGGVPMLAPITLVCDRGSGGSDNGIANSGECTTAGTLGGDVFVPGAFNASVSAMDANNDGCVELPFVGDPTTLTPCNRAAASALAPQATIQQVVGSVATHELGHATGVNTHTTDSTDLMYQYTINWTRANHFSSTAAGLVQIHNKGKQ